MAVAPGSVTINRHLILFVLAIICFAIDAFLEFAKVAVQGNVVFGLLFLGLVFFAGAFL
jgi:hypothetical protein